MIRLPEGFDIAALFADFFHLAVPFVSIAFLIGLRHGHQQFTQESAPMNTIPSFPRIRRNILLIAFVGLCFLLGLLKRILL